MDKLSIIIPVYNSENYLARCLDTILNQSHQNLEIIVIDDGSTDKSPEILETYREKDPRIIYHRKENQGPGAARDLALALVTGDYIGFVDSDDYIHPDMYKAMLEKAIEYGADVVQCGYYKTDEKGTILEEKNFAKEEEIIEGHQASLVYEKRRKINNFLCTKIFKKENFQGVTIPPLFYAEDQCALTQVFYQTAKVLILPTAYYYYVTNPHSLFHSNFNIKQLDSIKAGKFMYNHHREKESNLYKYSSLRITYYIIKFRSPLSQSNIEEKKQLLKQLDQDFKTHQKNFKKDQAWQTASKKRKLLITLARLNLKATSYLFTMYRKIFNKY